MEPTLSIPFRELKARVGSYLGWGRGSDIYGDGAWTDQQNFELDGVLSSGLRQFCQSPQTAHEPAGYNWSFLHPTVSLSLLANGSSVTLPDDFGGFEGELTILTTTTTSQPFRIRWVGEAQVRAAYSRTPSMIGPPMYAAERPLKGTSATAGQRSDLFIFPLADQAYTLQVQYYVNLDYLTVAFPYMPGGSQHTETILESCLAIAEERLDDQRKDIGPHGTKFLERLQASIAIDRRNKPQNLGYNRDRSDYQDDRRGWWPLSFPAATYAGQPFE